MNKHMFLVTVAIIATLSFPVVAQDHGPPAGGSDKNLKDNVSDLKGRSNEIERVKRDAEKPEASPAPNFSQIKEDFERIQIINSDVLQVNASSGSPAYESISEAAAEIKKRAIRLKSNLFPKSEKQSKENGPGIENQDLKALLGVLDKAVADFTHSPMFQNTKVVTPQDSTNAQKDLEKVIKFSAEIKLEAGRMKKASSPQ
ncbi:MAG TPA: hypothetical protein VE135_11870 [Pyrinomonadaceae bacterium]|nr:hypothetical protein [Pyrinomonadaceae bacterium]